MPRSRRLPSRPTRRSIVPSTQAVTASSVTSRQYRRGRQRRGSCSDRRSGRLSRKRHQTAIPCKVSELLCEASMRLKSLTTLNTLLLIAVCLALGATLWWSERAMERPYLLMVRYLALSQQFQQQAVDNIHGYLASGDALRHSQAQQALSEFADDSSAPPPD